jgi:hypothetical protein
MLITIGRLKPGVTPKLPAAKRNSTELGRLKSDIFFGSFFFAIP